MQNIRNQAGGDVESNAEYARHAVRQADRSRSSCRNSRDIDYRVYNATLDFDLGFATLTSATSYNELESPFRSDLTTQFSPLLIAALGFGPNELLQEQTTKYDKVTQELRLASPSNDTFEWLVGAYYTKEKGDIIQHIEAVVPGTLDSDPGNRCSAMRRLHSEYEEMAASPAARFISASGST